MNNELEHRLRASLGEIMQLVETGVLVRNTKDDGDFPKYAAQSFKLCAVLKAAQIAMSEQSKGE